VPRYTHSDDYHQAFEPNGGEDIGTEEERYPKESEGISFYLARDNLVFPEASYMITEIRVVHQPSIHAM
jgi:hypothetical protein